jgi:hypothetical protein
LILSIRVALKELPIVFSGMSIHPYEYVSCGGCGHATATMQVDAAGRLDAAFRGAIKAFAERK